MTVNEDEIDKLEELAEANKKRAKLRGYRVWLGKINMCLDDLFEDRDLDEKTRRYLVKSFYKLNSELLDKFKRQLDVVMKL